MTNPTNDPTSATPTASGPTHHGEGEVTINGIRYLVRSTLRGWSSTPQAPGFDIFEIRDGGERQLTVADPFGHHPSPRDIDHFLDPRKQALVSLMARYRIVAGDDYQYEADYELLESPGRVGRYVAVHGDETYHQIFVTDERREALAYLGGIDGDEYCGNIVGVYDLDTEQLLATTTTVTIDHPTMLPQLRTLLDACTAGDNTPALLAALRLALHRWPDLDVRDEPDTLQQALARLLDAGLRLGDIWEQLAARRTAHDLTVIERARAHHAGDEEIDIDDTAVVSASNDDPNNDGNYVLAWVWTPNPETPPVIEAAHADHHEADAWLPGDTASAG